MLAITLTATLLAACSGGNTAQAHAEVKMERSDALRAPHVTIGDKTTLDGVAHTLCRVTRRGTVPTSVSVVATRTTLDALEQEWEVANNGFFHKLFGADNTLDDDGAASLYGIPYNVDCGVKITHDYSQTRWDTMVTHYGSEESVVKNVCPPHYDSHGPSLDGGTADDGSAIVTVICIGDTFTLTTKIVPNGTEASQHDD